MLNIPRYKVAKHDLRCAAATCRCALASCKVRLDPILIVTCDVHACGAFQGLRSVTAISNNILAIMKELRIKMCLLEFKAMFKS